jgi:hypothetical protein
LTLTTERVAKSEAHDDAVLMRAGDPKRRQDFYLGMPRAAWRVG